MMPLRKKQLPVPNSLIASAVKVNLNETAWRSYRLRDEQWQRETWRLYDQIGEFRFAAGYIGSAVSRVRIFVSELDELGRVSGEVEDDDEVQAIADTLFGGPAAKSENLRLIGISLMVAGECFIVGKAAESGESRNGEIPRDQWFVVSPGGMRRLEGGLVFRHNGRLIRLDEGRDIVIRLWTPHPADPDLADSPARSALPILTEMERLTMYAFSQYDSRLASAGILPIPNNIDFPQGDDEDAPGGAEGLMKALIETGTESLKGHGSAAGVFPILVEMPIEALQAMKDEPIRFESVLSEHFTEYWNRASRRLATSLDMPPEVLEGAAETNHWGIWYVEENAIKIHIEPLMTRIVDALTRAYLQPALRALGRDPADFVFEYDTAPLTNRPNRLQDTLNLYERGIVSADAVLRAGNYNPAVDSPEQDEENKRFIRELMLRDPSLFASAPLREAIGIEIDTSVEAIESEETPPPPPPQPQRSVEEDTSPTPELPSNTRPANQTPQPTVTAGSGVELVPEPSPVLVGCNALVRRALEKAGGKLLTRSERGRWPHVPHHELHTRIRVQGEDHAEQLLAGAWSEVSDALEGVDVDPQEVASALHNYSKTLLLRSLSHNRTMLNEVLRHRGLTS